MPIHNSLKAVDIYASFLTTICTPKDVLVARKRGADLNFLTKELPALGKSIDSSLSTGVLDLSTCRFKTKKGTKLPQYMYSLFEKVYTADGSLRFTLCAESLMQLRTACFFLYKLNLPFTEEQEEASYEKFLETDRKVKSDFTEEQIERIKPYIRSLMPDLLGDLIPEHGSGAVTEGLTNIEKVGFRAVPSDDYLNITWDYQNLAHALEHSKDIMPDCSIARYINVPKDSRGPRGIALQPTRYMAYQKAGMRLLYEFIESSSPGKGYVNFTNQHINQRLAQKASIDQRYCTIDLKDASDLVSWDLIKQCVSEEWLNLLTATRCESIEINGEIHPLRKFASMGSALCFPIEAICFWAIARSVSNEVYVYGDDIIAPNQDFEVITQALQEYGLIVNIDKSLYRGHFRESCGGDYYFGNNIAPLRLKSLEPLNVIAFANNLFERGFREAADMIVNSLEYKTKQIYWRGEINDVIRPFVYNNGRVASNDVFFKRRWNKELQIMEYRIPSMTNSKTKSVSLSEYDKYFEWLRGKAVADASAEHEHRENDWFGVQAAQSVETRAGYKWVAF